MAHAEKRAMLMLCDHMAVTLQHSMLGYANAMDTVCYISSFLPCHATALVWLLLSDKSPIPAVQPWAISLPDNSTVIDTKALMTVKRM